MAVKYVEGVGWVELAGELPTEEERVKLRALRDSKASTSQTPAQAEEAPAVPPSVQEVLSPLTQLQEGFAGVATIGLRGHGQSKRRAPLGLPHWALFVGLQSFLLLVLRPPPTHRWTNP